MSDKERELEYGTLFRDVASVISEKCVNPENNRPYTLTMIERGLKDLGFAVDPKRNAKQQALEALPQLQSKIPIRRARMRLKILVSPSFIFLSTDTKLSIHRAFHACFKAAAVRTKLLQQALHLNSNASSCTAMHS